jgi:hypothetical protein
MRILKASIWLCAYIVLCVCIAEADPAALARRQTNEATVEPTTPSTVTEPPSSTSSNESPRVEDASSSESSSPSRPSTNVLNPSAGAGDAVSSRPSSTGSAPSGMPSVTAATNGPENTAVANSTSNKAGDQADALPLPPKITPAIAIAGVFLILFGFTYAFIGIKNRWIQIFLSSAFLTSLSVTVLLVYVMSPEVRPAVQGAYLVAAFMTGIIFGAGALVFKEVTEGLGCLLGGFCLSMWLLTLKPGGTVQSTGGKVVLIAAFTVAAYTLSFTHYTRPYGLIGATSFAGATAAVLGVDCFTNAGLKEFWLYIWNLNDGLFPLNTNTYPITRGMKVELAVTVLICFLGVISQIKLWKVIKDRREKKDAARLGDEVERSQMEEAVGRRLEEGNERERAQWEAVYGDQEASKRNTTTDSGLGTEENNSLRKASVSVREVARAGSPAEIIESKEAGATNTEDAESRSAKDATEIRTAETAPGSLRDPSQDAPCSPETGPASAQPADGDSPDSAAAAPITAEGSPEALHPPLPLTKPLPFTIPSAEMAPRSTDSSNLTFDESEPVATPYATHSRGSSLAATVDDELDELDLVGHNQETPVQSETKSSSQAYMLAEDVALPGSGSFQGEDALEANQTAQGWPTHFPRSMAEDSDPEEFQRPVETKQKTKPVQLASSSQYHDNKAPPARPGALESQAEGSQAQDSVPTSNKRLSMGAVSSTGSLTKGALDRVPSQLSHVVMSYRTNEWAKHISTAKEPEFDAPEEIPEGAEEEFPVHLAERTAPVNVEKSQPTTTTLATLPAVQQQPSTISSPLPTDLNRAFSGKSDASNSNLPSGPASLESAAQPDILQVLGSQPRQGNTSAVDLSRSTSVTSQLPPLTTRGLRSSSTPVPGQTLMTSPIDEDAEAEFQPPFRRSISPLPTAGSTLLAQRDHFLKNKQYQSAARNTPSPTDMMYSQPPIRSNSRLSLIEEAGTRSASRLSNFGNGEPILPLRSPNRLSIASVDDENMPLSQRRAIIQQQQSTVLPENHLAPMSSFDAHLPQPSSSAATTQKRESMLASWRESMRQDAVLSSGPQQTVETRRAEMLMEKHQSTVSHQYSEATKTVHEQAFEQAMRRGDMQELHKQAMRKMQANANRHV